MKSSRVFIIIVGLFLAFAGIAITLATQKTASSVHLPSEVLTMTDNKERIRVAGRVTDDEIKYTVEPELQLTFSIRDPGTKEGKTLPVTYRGIKPDMFASGRDVIIDGDLQGGVLSARQLLTQCPSKYEPPSPTGMHEKK